MATQKKISRRSWNTYALSGYTHQVGSDPRATGGVHLYQVRKGGAGWQKRVADSNGNWFSPGPVTAVGESESEGEALFARAESY